MASEKQTPEGNIYDLMRKSAGINGFTTTTPPIGGRIKENIADFIVEGIMPNGDILSTRETYNPDVPFGNRNRVTRFTLIKKNTDTIYAAEVLRDYLQVPMGFIKWAGIKDHTAITSQRFSVRGNHMGKLKRFKHPHIAITHILPSRDDIDLGKLWGNKFTINLRHTSSPYCELLPDLTKWKQQIDKRGFPNFFGMQRFGQHRPNSHVTGKLIFEKKYREAVEEFLFTVYPLEYAPVALFRKQLSEDVHNPNVRSRIPHGLYYEKKMLDVLDQYPNDYKRILLSLPSSLINLILSSYQSYLFNTLVSHRLKVQDSLTHPVNGDTVSILKDPRGHPSLIFYKYKGGDGWNDDNILKAFKHDRASIVAPIIGFKTNLDDYPYYKPLYEELLEKEGFTTNQFLHDIPGLFFFDGTFRAICNRPTELQVSQAHILNKFPEMDPNGIKLEFSLPKGTYATMVLAELRKHSEEMKK